MVSPSEELQGALYRAFKADNDLMSLIHDVYDHVERGDEGFPSDDVWGDALAFISFGNETVVRGGVQCVETEDISIQIDVWSRRPGKVHCKRIVAEAVRVIVSLGQIAYNAIGAIGRPFTQVFLDRDGMTVHGVIVVEVQVEVNGNP